MRFDASGAAPIASPVPARWAPRAASEALQRLAIPHELSGMGARVMREDRDLAGH